MTNSNVIIFNIRLFNISVSRGLMVLVRFMSLKVTLNMENGIISITTVKDFRPFLLSKHKYRSIFCQRLVNTCAVVIKINITTVHGVYMGQMPGNLEDIWNMERSVIHIKQTTNRRLFSMA